MRIVQVLIPEEKKDRVETLLHEQELSYNLMEDSGEGEFSHLALIPTPSGKVEDLINQLQELGLDRDGMIVVSQTEAIVSENFERQENTDEEESAKKDRIASEELISSARSISRSTTNYLLFTVISAVVATAGLLADSASIVVGSMVIAPLIGPAMASSVGSVVNNQELFREGIYSQVIGTVLAILGATAFALVARFLVGPELDLLMFDQVAERVHPGLLSLAVALGAGVAGALAMTSGMSAALVGVMIAVALIPPAATVGLGLAYLEPGIAFSAFTLLVLNILCINLSAIVTFWAKGYGPERWYEVQESKSINLKRLAVLLLAIGVITAALTVTTLQDRANRQMQNSIHTFMAERDLPLHRLEVNYQLDLFYQSPREIVVHTTDENGELAGELRDFLAEHHGMDVPVVIVEQVRREAS